MMFISSSVLPLILIVSGVGFYFYPHRLASGVFSVFVLLFLCCVADRVPLFCCLVSPTWIIGDLPSVSPGNRGGKRRKKQGRTSAGDGRDSDDDNDTSVRLALSLNQWIKEQSLPHRCVVSTDWLHDQLEITSIPHARGLDEEQF